MSPDVYLTKDGTCAGYFSVILSPPKLLCQLSYLSAKKKGKSIKGCNPTPQWPV